MIINCIKCNKKFEVESSLIPNNGRNLQCGSCDHIWFYTPGTENSINEPELEIQKTGDFNLSNELKTLENKNLQNQDDNIHNKNIISKKKNTNNKPTTNNLDKKVSSPGSIRFLSFFLVLIISFVAVIILLDTFKSPLSDTFPSLELFLYNLFETVKDIYLFLKNLFI